MKGKGGIKFVYKLHTSIVFKSFNFKHQMIGKGARSLFANCIQYCMWIAYNQLFSLPPHTIFVCKLQTNSMLFPNNFLCNEWERGTKFVCELHTNIVFKSSHFKHQMIGKGAQSLFANCILYCV